MSGKGEGEEASHWGSSAAAGSCESRQGTACICKERSAAGDRKSTNVGVEL